jgi:hypothetical protein
VASPLLRHVVGSAVTLAALGASAALNLQALVLAVALGWPLGCGMGAAFAALRRPRGVAPPPA